VHQVSIILGPNLNMLGKRESQYYGDLTLDQIKKLTESKIQNLPVKIQWFQSNSESEIVEKIQACSKSSDSGIVINPGAYTHTSVAIHDALKTFKGPIVEVHLSNVTSRESFRSPRLTSQAASIIIEGLGKLAFYIGIISLLERIEDGISNSRS